MDEVGLVAIHRQIYEYLAIIIIPLHCSLILDDDILNPHVGLRGGRVQCRRRRNEVNRFVVLKRDL